MDFKNLYTAADRVVDALNNPPKTASLDVLTSIKNQMEFIRDNASKGVNPSKVLPPNTTFTYAILASRELESPDELMLQRLIDDVTKELLRVS